MDKIKRKIEKIVDRFFLKPVNVNFWMVAFSSIVMLRIFLDEFVAKGEPFAFNRIVFIHDLLFFFLTFLLVWIFLFFILKKYTKKLSGLILWASLFIIFPPIFDFIKTGGEVFWSYYLIASPQELFYQFITFFGNLPSGNIYFGTRIVFALAIVLLSFVVWIKSKNLLRTLVSVLGTYFVLFFMASFPSIFYYLYCFFDKGCYLMKIQSFEIVSLFAKHSNDTLAVERLGSSLIFYLNFFYFLLIVAGLLFLFYLIDKKKFLAVISNWRYPQIIYHSGLLFIGLSLGILAYPDNFSLSVFSLTGIIVLFVSIWLAWKVSVVVNDIYDIEIDKISNRSRPLPSGQLSIEEYKMVGVLAFTLSIIGGLIISPIAGFLLIVYQIMAWFYSSKPFRLKRFLVLATLWSALASQIILLIGFVFISGENELQGLSPLILLLLVSTYTLCLPIKDFKDIEGDKKFRVLTLPVILGERKGRLVLAVNFFISYMLSVFLLHEFSLFFWALGFGIISFLVITNQKIKSRELPWWGLGLVFLYGLILSKILFF